MTNDGDLANSLSKAAAGVEKTYLVKGKRRPPGRGTRADPPRHHDRSRPPGRGPRRPPRPLSSLLPPKWNWCAAEIIRGSRSPSLRAATGSSARCSRRSATTSKRFAASDTAHCGWTSHLGSTANSSRARSWRLIAPPRAARSSPRRTPARVCQIEDSRQAQKPLDPAEPLRQNHAPPVDFFVNFGHLDRPVSKAQHYSCFSTWQRGTFLERRASKERYKEHQVAMELATFGAGCFWGVEARFGEMTGVIDTAVGYEGGVPRTSDLQGSLYRPHRPRRSRAGDLRQLPHRLRRTAGCFFTLHDPTQLNRQGPDWGSQYRSVIFTHSDEQMAAARGKIAELSAAGTFRKPIVTEVTPQTNFWKAEEYHQRYLEKRGMVSCHI